MDVGLDGQRVLVTAGASGIGRAIAAEMVAGGARVAVCDNDEGRLDDVQQALPSVVAVRADVADEDEVQSWVHRSLAELGGVDVLVNNAGIAGPSGVVEDLDVAGWRRTLDVNVTGMFLTARLVVPHLKRQRSGSIINIASTAGQFGFPYRAPYAASKWAVIGFTKTLAMELGPFGVRVNAICPGSVANERMDRVVALEAAASGRAPEEIRRGFEEQVSLRTFVDPEDVAAMARFLCTPAGARVSGQALAVDGHTETLRT